MTKQQYVEDLVSTPKHCTCPSLAEQRADVSHAVVNAFLRQQRFMPRAVGKGVQDRRAASKDAFLLGEDSGQDTRSSRCIELVRAQYRGTAPGVGRGSGVVSLGHSGGKAEACYPLDSRGMPPPARARPRTRMATRGFVNAVDPQQSHARPSLCEGW